MEFLELVQNRYSVRAYKPDALEEEKLNHILESARLAPTAANRQPVRIIVIHTAGREEELKRIYHRDWFVSAPVLICICTLASDAWVRGLDGKNYADVDAAIIMDHLVLAATELGLGTCWVAAFNPEHARQVLQLPEDVAPLLFTPLGYPADSPKGKERKPLSELVHYEHW
jgi:nitroreductase